MSSVAQIGTILNCDTEIETSGHNQAEAQVDNDHLSDMTSDNDTHTTAKTNISTPSNTKGCKHCLQQYQVNKILSGTNLLS